MPCPLIALKEISMYQKKQYDPRACIICGTVFQPYRQSIVTCSNPECKRKAKLERQKAWYRENYTRVLEENRKYRKEIKAVEQTLNEPHKPKPDTIVAIGYAERQRKQTLEMVGKVKTEL